MSRKSRIIFNGGISKLVGDVAEEEEEKWQQMKRSFMMEKKEIPNCNLSKISRHR